MEDEYQNALNIQNSGGVCPHCGASLGHYVNCALQLAPYQHELNSSGTACDINCPACIWVDLQVLIVKRKGNQPTKVDPEVAWLEALAALPDNRS